MSESGEITIHRFSIKSVFVASLIGDLEERGRHFHLNELRLRATKLQISYSLTFKKWATTGALNHRDNINDTSAEKEANLKEEDITCCTSQMAGDLASMSSSEGST
ncbi:uncharacterized protein EAF02_006108 [Botrytis sinoallii]|uniref:uncharacterized protein n=1 Tax=Botrytis sinoallii TaxID=1463999 RepID=UPI0019024211|nr:uncharacterized protein EAF02_006108 [Botrytis sinoallii]KAF7882745.1 hypothetical protein EAF02_006108 [Botrytis sinoallii]